MTDNLAIVAPAFLAGLLVLATHVPLGTMVLDRGIVFVDIAVAQAAALGMAVGHIALGAELSSLAAQGCAVAAALLCSSALAWSEPRAGEAQEAVIGAVFVAIASTQLVLMSFDSHNATHFKDVLVGQILWVGAADLLGVGALYAAILAAWRWGDLTRYRARFYAVFALAITASVQLIGVYLVFASLIIPALAARSIAGSRRRLLIAYGVGVVGYALGIVVSLETDLPTGSVIVCALALAACAVWTGRRVSA